MSLTTRVAGRTALAVAAALSVGSLAGAPAAAQSAPVQLQVVGINDFHGHLDPRTGAASVAGVLGGAVAALRAENPNTVFVSAGDNIGASPFISSSQQDTPTLDVLDAMGLAVSAVGNHEFDRGYADLAGRVTDRADFPFLGANVVGESPDLPAYEVVETGGVRLGFIGVVTRETASLVSPAGIRGITFEDPVVAANRVAAALTDDDEGNGEADVLVLLAHEGAATAAAAPTGATGGTAAACAAIAERADAFGEIVREVSADVDAVLGGHTHLNVDCELPGPGGALRPVLEAQQYGEAITRLRLTYDPATGEVTAATGDVLRADRHVLPGRPGGRGHRHGRRRSRARSRPGGGGPHHRRHPAGHDGGRRRGPRERVAARQLHRRRAAVGRRRPRRGWGADRLHEPRRPARRPAARRPVRRRGAGRSHLRRGRRRPAVRQHAVHPHPHRRAGEAGARGAVPAGRQHAAVPRPRRLEGPALRLRRHRPARLPHPQPHPRRRPDRPRRDLPRGDELVPRLGWRQLRDAGHRHRPPTTPGATTCRCSSATSAPTRRSRPTPPTAPSPGPRRARPRLRRRR